MVSARIVMLVCLSMMTLTPERVTKPGRPPVTGMRLVHLPLMKRSSLSVLRLTSDFTIGRAVVAKVNLKTDKLDLFINGKWTKRIPVTGGRPGFVTRSGVKVIMDKQTNITMRAETIGLKKDDPNYYADTPVKYAMRVTNSGEFLHTAPWSVADQGKRNVSHGCTGMSDANGQWLFGQMQIGDVVETTGTSRPMTMGNGYSDWNLSWAKWTAGSAL